MHRTPVLPLPRLFLLLLLACSGVAHAWNGHGHRLVADLAEPQLAPATRAEVRRLLAIEGATSMAQVASWADEVRGTGDPIGKRSARWHFVNMAEHGCTYEAPRDCAGGECVVAAIQEQAAILADPRQPDAERLQALKFVIHLVGDAHQPMHAGYGHDRGGNHVQVNVRGKGTNLHALWDGELLPPANGDAAGQLAALQASPVTLAPGVEPFTHSASAVWVEQSCRIVTRPGVYPGKAKIEQAYLDQHRPTAEAQVRLAGARLARLLNEVLS